MAFMEGRMEDLYRIQRTGTRGRIFSHMVAETLRMLEMSCRSEPVFEYCDPNPWYVDFAARNGLKLRGHSFHNPDFVLDDGTWVEATIHTELHCGVPDSDGHPAEICACLLQCNASRD